MTEKPVDGGCQTGAVLTNLSITFECIDHKLLKAKLYAYEFDKKIPSTSLIDI